LERMIIYLNIFHASKKRLNYENLCFAVFKLEWEAMRRWRRADKELLTIFSPFVESDE
jgi:hypothetical protein